MFDLVTVHYRAPHALLRQLHALERWSHAPASVTVVDNSALDGDTAAFRRELNGKAALLEYPENPGYGAAANRALETVLRKPAAYVLLAAEDAVYDEAAVTALLAYLESDARTAVAAPLLTYASDPKRVFSAGGFIDNKARRSHMGEGTSSEQWGALPPYEVDWAHGTLLLLRKSALRQVGSFDERYFRCFEEVDLQLRLRLSGWSVRLVPNAAVCAPHPGDFSAYFWVRNRALLQRNFPQFFDQRPWVTTLDSLHALVRGLSKRQWSAPGQVLRARRDLKRGRFGNPSLR